PVLLPPEPERPLRLRRAGLRLVPPRPPPERQRRSQRASLTANRRGIQRADLPQNHPERPAVEDNVVVRQDEEVILGLQGEQPRSQQWTADQAERRTHLRAEHRRDLRLSRLRLQRG